MSPAPYSAGQERGASSFRSREASSLVSTAAASSPFRCALIPNWCTSTMSRGLGDSRRRNRRDGVGRSSVPRRESRTVAYSASDDADVRSSPSRSASRRVNVRVRALGRSRAINERSSRDAAMTRSAASSASASSLTERCDAASGSTSTATRHARLPSDACVPTESTSQVGDSSPSSPSARSVCRNTAAISGERQTFCAHTNKTLSAISITIPSLRRRIPRTRRLPVDHVDTVRMISHDTCAVLGGMSDEGNGGHRARAHRASRR